MAGVIEAFHDATGLPTVGDAMAAHERISQLFDDARQSVGLPTRDDVSEAIDQADRAVEELGDRTGLPTYHDLYDTLDAIGEDANQALDDALKRAKDIVDPPPGQTDDESEDDYGWIAWTVGGVISGAVVVYTLLNRDITIPIKFEFEIPGFGIDGVPVSELQPYDPGPPYAARVLDPLLHGGILAPGPGHPSVIIGGRPAVTMGTHSVCGMPTVAGVIHGPGVLMSTNGEVLVEGLPLARAGDYMLEPVGGINPIISGCPTVLTGAPAPSVMVLAERFAPLSEYVPGLEEIGYSGTTVAVDITITQNLFDALAVAAALWLGGPSTLKYVLSWIEGPSVAFDVTLEPGDVGAVFRDEAGKQTRVVLGPTALPGAPTGVKAKGTIKPKFPDIYNSPVKIEEFELL